MKNKKGAMGAGWIFLAILLLASSVLYVGVKFADRPGMVAGQAGAAMGEQLPISTFTALSYTKYGNSYTTADGNVSFFKEGDEPGSSNTNPIDSISVVSGTGSSTAKLLTTDTKYRVAFNAEGTDEYDKDFGTITAAASANYNKETGIALFQTAEILTVATIDDLFDETQTNGDLNGQATTNVTISTTEIGCADGCGADGVLIYDESQADGTVYVNFDPSFSGANSAAAEPVLCFVWEQGAEPEGNEITDMTLSRISGEDFGLASSVLDDWKNQRCLKLKTNDNYQSTPTTSKGIVKSGTSATYKLQITYDEAQLDTGDDWSLVIDDLSENQGKDIFLSLKGTRDVLDFDASA